MGNVPRKQCDCEERYGSKGEHTKRVATPSRQRAPLSKTRKTITRFSLNEFDSDRHGRDVGRATDGRVSDPSQIPHDLFVRKSEPEGPHEDGQYDLCENTNVLLAGRTRVIQKIGALISNWENLNPLGSSIKMVSSVARNWRATYMQDLTPPWKVILRAGSK